MPSNWERRFSELTDEWCKETIKAVTPSQRALYNMIQMLRERLDELEEEEKKRWNKR